MELYDRGWWQLKDVGRELNKVKVQCASWMRPLAAQELDKGENPSSPTQPRVLRRGRRAVMELYDRGWWQLKDVGRELNKVKVQCASWMRPLAAQELDKGFAGVASWRSEKTMVAVVFVAVAVPVSLLIWTAAGLLYTSRVCAVSDAIPAASLKMDGSGAFGVLSMATRACGGGSGAAGLGSLLGQSDGGGCGVSGPAVSGSLTRTDGVGSLGGKLVGWLLRLLLIEALCGNIIPSISGVAYLRQIVTRQGFSRRYPNSCMFKASWSMETFFKSPCSSIQVEDSIRVEYRPSSRLLSIGLQSVLLKFDGELLDNILLSPVKLKKNL
uniref:Uncharacterized protein n=1 Tax=Oryza meridionalis TaxID=40149 RepID=A0A0E0E7C5_9ORYZ